MDLLLLGGPKFVGRAVIEAALAAGRSVTVFNRGQTNPGAFPEVEELRGDRDGHLDALKGRSWDVVVDTSGYVPRIVKQSAELLADSVGRYVFISSVSVYRDFGTPGIDEDFPLARLKDETTEESMSEAYGGLKVLCENVLREAYGGRALLIRPGLIVGPHDPTDRFTYWVTRPARGGEVLAPVGPEYPVQVIDVRDLAEWTLRMAEANASGAYNATGPDYDLTMGRLLDAAKDVSGSDATFTWASEEFLLGEGVAPWSELPLWVPQDMHILGVSIAKALAAGLTFRPIEETVRDTLEWARSRPEPDPPLAGLTSQRESELLDAWHARE